MDPRKRSSTARISVMLRRVALSFAILFCMGKTRPLVAQVSVSEPVKHQIESELEEQIRAANAHDVDLYLRSFSRDPKLTFAVFDEIIHGFDSLHKAQLKWWRNGTSDATYTVRAPAEFNALSSNLLLVTQAMHSRRSGQDGKPVEKDFVITTIWKNLPDGWRVIYGHESWAR